MIANNNEIPLEHETAMQDLHSALIDCLTDFENERLEDDQADNLAMMLTVLVGVITDLQCEIKDECFVTEAERDDFHELYGSRLAGEMFAIRDQLLAELNLVPQGDQ